MPRHAIDDADPSLQARSMSRRDFLTLAPLAIAGALTGCTQNVPAASRTAPGRSKIRGVCFDLFTLFDPRSVVTAARAVAGDGAADLCEAWRTRQFQYAFLRAAGERYLDFRRCTEDALDYAAKSRSLTLLAADRARLVDAYSELEPWPDTRKTLEALRAAGLSLAPLANYAPAMLDRLLAHADLTDHFDAIISTDAAQTFKPSPRAYALGPARLGLPREAVAFAAFGGWDAAGAKWFGLPTFWVNRLSVQAEELDPTPDGTGPTLAELSTFIREWA
jgi:2-haloacid dehalogenase